MRSQLFFRTLLSMISLAPKAFPLSLDSESLSIFKGKPSGFPVIAGRNKKNIE